MTALWSLACAVTAELSASAALSPSVLVLSVDLLSLVFDVSDVPDLVSLDLVSLLRFGASLLSDAGGAGSSSSERELSAARGWPWLLEAVSRGGVLSGRGESWAARGGGGAARSGGGSELCGSAGKLLSTIAAKLLVSCEGSGRAGFVGAF
jgi:hypothetical protein